MPSKSTAQHNLMEAVAHDTGFAKKAGIPKSVGKEFVKADEKDGYRKSKSKDSGRASALRQRLGVLPRKSASKSR